MKILVTGVAGFIGYRVASRLLGRGDSVVGLDNLNDYCPGGMKCAHLSRLGIADAGDIADGEASGCGSFPAPSRFCGKFRFYKCDLSDRMALPGIFARERFDAVINFAAGICAGHSVTHPFNYMDPNVVGFVNLLECCRSNGTGHLVYAVPTESPASPCAATGNVDEMLAYSYSALYGLPATGLRFFAVKVPDDVDEAAVRVLDDAPEAASCRGGVPHRIFDVGYKPLK